MSAAIVSIDPAEPIDRIDPAEPIDRIDPAEPIDSIDPAEPIDRIDPTDIRLATEATENADPADSTDPIDHTDATDVGEAPQRHDGGWSIQRPYRALPTGPGRSAGRCDAPGVASPRLGCSREVTRFGKHAYHL